MGGDAVGVVVGKSITFPEVVADAVGDITDCTVVLVSEAAVGVDGAGNANGLAISCKRGAGGDGIRRDVGPAVGYAMGALLASPSRLRS